MADDPQYVYNLHRMRAQIAIRLCHILAEEKCSNKELSQRMGLTEKRIDELLSANGDLSIKFLIKVAMVLGRRLDVQFLPPENKNEK